MKINVRNLGIIRQQVEIDLKPLTIFIGPNNSGKTWLAYTLAGIFGEHSRSSYLKEERLEEVAQAYPPLIEAINKILDQGTAKIDIVQFAEDYIAFYFNNLSSQVKEWLPEFMSTRLISFADLELSINLDTTKKRLIKQVQATSIHSGMGNRQKPLLDIRKKKGEKHIYIHTDYDKEIEEELPREMIEGFLARGILRILHQSLYSNVFILPTERSTLISFPFNEAEKQRIAAEDIAFQQPLGRPLSHPVALSMFSYITMYTMGSKEKAKRERKENNTPEVKEYIRLAQILEHTILCGQVDLSHPEPDPTREIVFQPTMENNISLEISITSSMVKVLSPLVFYLRYFALPGELLIIDEPEMNLHPKAQVQVIEFLAMLANAGLHVLITTHSPYMVDHLTNLTTAAQHTDKEAIRSEFYLQDSNAFISKENVSLYLFDHGTVKDAMNDENQDWDTFGEVSDRISEIFFTL